MVRGYSIVNDMSPLDAALFYFDQGLVPIPANTSDAEGHCSCGRESCDNVGKHPRLPKWKQYQTEKPTREQVVKWWTRWPDANIALSTEGRVIVDVDDEIGYTALEAAGHELPSTATVKTGRGHHRYYAAPEGVEVRSKVGVVEKVDIRAGGGLIVVPPSLHASGVRYQWEKDNDGFDLAEAPEWACSKQAKDKAKGLPATVSDPTFAGVSETPAAMRFLDERCASVRWAGEGTRQVALNVAAFRCGEHVGRGLSSDVAHERLLEAGIAAGLPAYSCSATVRSALAAGADKAHSGFKCDEQGLASRFEQVFSHMARYSEDEERWRIFDGRRWAADTRQRHRVASMMEAVIDLYVEDAKRIEDAKVAQAIIKFAKSYRTHTKVISAVKTVERRLLIDSESFDNAPGLLNVTNGTLDLASGTLRPASADDLITRLADVTFDSNATAPRFQAFLERVLPNESVREWLARYCGYVLAGQPNEQCFCTFLGDGSNGKSTLLSLLSQLLGDYSMTTPAETFIASSRSNTQFQEMARLGRGTRLLIGSEPPESAKLDESFIKQFTGSDLVAGCAKYSSTRTFVPQAVLIMASNAPLELSSSNVALTRRIKVVPFDVTISDEERDKELPSVLRAEASGVLNWLVAGYRAYVEKGLADAPEAVAEAGAEYVRASDTFADFAEARCNFYGGGVTSRKSMYEEYTRWCRARDIVPRSNKAVASSLRGTDGVGEKKVKGSWYWTGVSLAVTHWDPALAGVPLEDNEPMTMLSA